MTVLHVQPVDPPLVPYATCPPGCTSEQHGDELTVSLPPADLRRALRARAAPLAAGAALVIAAFLGPAVLLASRGGTLAAWCIVLTACPVAVSWFTLSIALTAWERRTVTFRLAPDALHLDVRFRSGRTYHRRWTRDAVAALDADGSYLRVSRAAGARGAAGARCDVIPLLHVPRYELRWAADELRRAMGTPDAVDPPCPLRPGGRWLIV